MIRSLADLLVLMVAAIPIFISSVEQVLYELAFWLSFASMWLWGWVFLQKFFLPPGQCVTAQARDDAPSTWVAGDAPGLFTTVLIGQFVVLFLAYSFLPLNMLLHNLTGFSLPLYCLFPLSTVILFVLRRQRIRSLLGTLGHGGPLSLGEAIRERPIWLFLLMGLSALATIVAVQSRNLAALGVDLHQHTAWAQGILEAGFVPLAEPHTRLISGYPKGFHLLGALWAAGGLGLPVGPFLKIMPFLQNSLVCFAVAELLLRRQEPRKRIALSLVLGLAFWLYAFYIVQLPHPTRDLVGTARFSSNALLALPLMLILWGWHCRTGRGSLLALAFLPILIAWTLLFNPMVMIQFIFFVLPFTLVWALFYRPQGGNAPLAWAKLLRLGSAAILVAGYFVTQDPWVIAGTADRFPQVSRLLQGAKLKTLQAAIDENRVSPRDIHVQKGTPRLICQDLGCYVEVGWTSLGQTVKGIPGVFSAFKGDLNTALEGWAAIDFKHELARGADGVVRGVAMGLKNGLGRLLPLGGDNFRDYAFLAFFSVVFLGVVLSLLRFISRGSFNRIPRSADENEAREGDSRGRVASSKAEARVSEPETGECRNASQDSNVRFSTSSLALERFLLVAGLALLVGNFGHSWVIRWTGALEGGLHSFALLAGYARASGLHLGLAFNWFLFGPAAAICLLWLASKAHHLVRITNPGSCTLSRFRPEQDRWKQACVIGLLLFWVLMPNWGKNNVNRPMRHPGFWSPLALADLDQLRTIEEGIPEEESVLIPAEHWNIADWENWVIPVGETTSLLPYGRKRFLFNCYLGFSYHYSWRDLAERLCSDKAGERQRFLRQAGAHWFLLRRKEEERPEEAFAKATICGRSLIDFGVRYPPVKEEGRLMLFQLDLPSGESSL